jgi:hypothetical protein
MRIEARMSDPSIRVYNLPAALPWLVAVGVAETAGASVVRAHIARRERK